MKFQGKRLFEERATEGAAELRLGVVCQIAKVGASPGLRENRGVGQGELVKHSEELNLSTLSASPKSFVAYLYIAYRRAT